MYAIIEQGGKQEKVEEGSILDIELVNVPDDAKTIELDKVLFVKDGGDIKVGTPYLDKAKVIASFKSTAAESIVKGKKLYPMHFRRRKNSRRRIGHRQKYMQVKVEKIKV